jgi:hypothetical protein
MNSPPCRPFAVRHQARQGSATGWRTIAGNALKTPPSGATTDAMISFGEDAWWGLSLADLSRPKAQVRVARPALPYPSVRESDTRHWEEEASERVLDRGQVLDKRTPRCVAATRPLSATSSVISAPAPARGLPHGAQEFLREGVESNHMSARPAACVGFFYSRNSPIFVRVLVK